jgi:hypothetical protein
MSTIRIRIHYLDISSALVYDVQVMQYENLLSHSPPYYCRHPKNNTGHPSRHFSKPIHAELTEVVRGRWCSGVIFDF